MGLLLYQAGWTVSAITEKVHAILGDKALDSAGKLSKRSLEVAAMTTVDSSVFPKDAAADGSIIRPLVRHPPQVVLQSRY